MELSYTRRDVLRSSLGLAGMTLPTFFSARAGSAETGAPRAKSCIVVYCWGGISHLESFDPKPEGPSETRGEFAAIPTATPGIRFSEHLPLLAKHSAKLAVIRSVHHDQGGHQQGMYVSLTGHKLAGGRAMDLENWPSMPSMISRFREPGGGGFGAIRLPHSMFDNGKLMAGEYGGWLGKEYNPVLMRTPAGRPFGGTSRSSGGELDMGPKIETERMGQRRSLLRRLERDVSGGEYDRLDRFHRMAADLLIDSPVRHAYELDRENPRIRGMYGNSMGGQGMLLARRLVEADVPVVQICAGAGDLAGGSGDNWDTHRDHFRKMKERLLPVFDRSVSALLTDLEMRGMLEETLVAILTDFGRTPKINAKGGRDHHPAAYSVVLAGGGIQGGQVYGSSDSSGHEPASLACSPADVHATCYKALGIDPRAELYDKSGKPFRICDGQPLPLF